MRRFNRLTEVEMNNYQFLSHVAKERQGDFLREAKNNRQLNATETRRPIAFLKKGVVALGVLLPLVLLLVRVVSSVGQ
jgi:hypothetical protein